MYKPKKVQRKYWAQVLERLYCADDIIERFHEDINLPPEFKDQLRAAQKSLAFPADYAFNKSLNKKERKEFYGGV